MKYYISTLNFSPHMKAYISDTLILMIERNVKNIEIASFHPYEKYLEELLKEYSKKINLLIHNFTPPDKENFIINLSSRHSGIRKKTSDFIKNGIILTKELGADYFSFHAGFRVDWIPHKYIYRYQSQTTNKKAMDIFIEEIDDILDIAEEEKIHIGIENHCSIKENRDNLILYDINDWQKLFNELSSNYLHLHLDLGHLKVSASENNFNKDTFIKRFGNKVMGMHIHDNVGIKMDSHSPFKIDDFWLTNSHFKQLKNLKYSILETITWGDMNLINNMINGLEKRRLS